MSKFKGPANVEITRYFAACTDEEIKRVEQQLNVTFPDDYQEFLREWNSIRLTDAVAGAADDTEAPIQVATLYGITANADGGANDLRSEQRAYDFHERVPDGVVKIGHSVSGYHAFCISTRQHDYGTVFYWDPGVPWEEGANEKTAKYLTTVALTFEAFWKSIGLSETE